MARIEHEAFADGELTRVFVAFTMAEAALAEQLLTASRVEYCVGAEAIGRTLFGSPRHGAVFSVAAGQAQHCASLLREAGLDLGILLNDPPQSTSTSEDG
jgi:hypothetical protein